MKLQDMLPYRRVSLLALALAATTVHAQSQSYCSNQNTGADYVGVKNIYNSFQACGDQCRGSYAFAVMQWQMCWCSNYAPASQQSVDACNQGCPGWPDNKCGNQAQGLFGYLALSIAPSGTAGGSSSPASSSSSVSPTQPSSTAQQSPPPQSTTPDPPTSYTTSTSTPIPTPSTPSTSTTSTTSTSDPPPPVVPAPVATDESTTFSTPTPTPVTSVRVVTVSGAVVTQYVTSTPIIASPSNANASSQQPLERREGLSGGAIAGIVIGVLAGFAIVILAAFLLWRRKSPADDEKSAATKTNSPKRNVSVLSKAGLLTRNRPSTGEKEEDHWHGATGNNSVRHSMLFGPGSEVSPVSPLGSSHDDQSRRHSRPFVYDQRLNPSALFANAEANGSRISMQDTQDYSRPLGIANPDPRSSFDSRASRHG